MQSGFPVFPPFPPAQKRPGGNPSIHPPGAAPRQPMPQRPTLAPSAGKAPEPHGATSVHSQRSEALRNGLPLMLAALLLRRFPDAGSSFQLLSSDWKVWAKIPLGLGIAGEITRFSGWKPPDWARAMLNVAVMAPLMRFPASRSEALRMLGGMAVLLPGVAALVKGTDLAIDKAEKPLREQVGVPPWATRLAVSTGATLLGLGIFHRLKGLGLTAIQGCLRCGGGCAGICATELGEAASAAHGMLASPKDPPEKIKH